MKKKVLYIMHIDWNWIKQRPQFLAEELSKYYDITVTYQIPYRRHNLTKSKKPKINTFRFLAIPLKGRVKLLSTLNDHFVRFQMKLLLLFKKYDFIWVTHPSLYSYIPKYHSSKVIYDCMDDALEFPGISKNKIMREKLFKLENRLCKESNFIFASSQYLKNELVNRYGIEKEKILVVNNGIHLKDLEIKDLPQDIKRYFDSKMKKIVYIGTISEWFDFDLILKSLNEVKGVNYLLFGSTEVKIPKHKNIIYCGPVDHKYVSGIMQFADLLIMPFKVNKLIRGVDPVKVYEYIYSKKPSIIVEYEETKKFNRFVYLYKNADEYISILKKIISDQSVKKVSNKEIEDFINKSTWEHRAKEIFEKLDSYYA